MSVGMAVVMVMVMPMFMFMFMFMFMSAVVTVRIGRVLMRVRTVIFMLHQVCGPSTPGKS
jgi:hypothetical protein